MKTTILFRASISMMFSCFLALPAQAWKIGLDFNDGAIGAVAQGPGGFSGAAGGTHYTADRAYEGGRAAELKVNAGETAFGKWGGIINHPSLLKKGDQIWFRVRTFMPIGFDYNSTSEGAHLKFLRIHTQSSSGANEGYNDWYINPRGSSISHKFIFEGEQKWSMAADDSFAPKLGVWETYEVYVKFDNIPKSQGGEARVRLWKNGVLLQDIQDRRTLVSASSTSDRTHLFTYWNGGAPKSQAMYVDDIVLTSDTPAARDSQGHPFVGVGRAQESPAPVPPAAPKLNVRY